MLQANKMELECLLCLAYMVFNENKWAEAKVLFENAYFVSRFVSLSTADSC